jgi:hypothetical protein
LLREGHRVRRIVRRGGGGTGGGDIGYDTGRARPVS